MPINPRLVRATNILERRLFLKALALGFAAPFAFKLARTATAQTTAAPKRLFVLFLPHGVPPEHYNPRVGSSPTDFALDQTNVSILGPLEQYKQYVNVYGGFQYPGKGDTHAGIVNCLSGYTEADETAPRTSVEHVIANSLGVKPLILGACSHQPFGLDRTASCSGTARRSIRRRTPPRWRIRCSEAPEAALPPLRSTPTSSCARSY